MTEKPGEYDVTIDGEDYRVIPGLPKSQEGKEVAFEVDVTEILRPDPSKEVAAEYVPDPGAREWKLITKPRPVGLYKGIRAPGETVLCMNDRCTKLVPESLNPGVERKFCCRPCAMRYHQRLYGARQRDLVMGRLEVNATGKQLRFNRTRPRDYKAALARYRAHLEAGNCPNATEETRKRCPSHMLEDPYSSRRWCLIYAVLVDDMKEQFARERGEIYYRQWTTGDGHWLEIDLDDPDVARHMSNEGERLHRARKILAALGIEERELEIASRSSHSPEASKAPAHEGAHEGAQRS